MYILIIYRIITFILRPVEYLYFLYRRLINKEDKKRFNERLGKASVKRPIGKLLWIHAASVGESLSVISLLNLIKEKFPDIKILITTGTVTSAAIIKQKLSTYIMHQYIPIDNIIYVRKFLNYWKPDLSIWLESELWPNLIFEAATSCNLILLNARMSETSYLRWLKLPKFIESLLGQFSIIIPQSKGDIEKFQNLGAKKTIYLGNIKYSALPLSFSEPELDKLKYMIKDRKFWVAASTHRGEEEKIANVHLKLKALYPGMLTIIIPRHPSRAEFIKEMLSAKELNVVVRTNNDEIKDNTDIYLVDTLGELGLFYHLTEIAFIGGSLITNGGGHNPIEAAHHNCAIIMGPYQLNFSEICQAFKEKEAILLLESEQELTSTLQMLFENSDNRLSLALAAKNLVNEMSDIVHNVLTHLSPWIEKGIRSKK
ncbi:3-deoxy-D-manno-octulosonic-acid transferase [Rickettsiales bacterium Ac37b]|nr:3-deoxy-D-manno-octulosonic-acid transferase [Rickettsiales bacterium Ac37b]